MGVLATDMHIMISKLMRTDFKKVYIKSISSLLTSAPKGHLTMAELTTCQMCIVVYSCQDAEQYDLLSKRLVLTPYLHSYKPRF